MVATDAFVYLPEYVIGIFLPYALKNGRREALFIKGPPPPLVIFITKDLGFDLVTLI